MINKYKTSGIIYKDEIVSEITINGKTYILPKKITLTAKDQQYCLRDNKESILTMILLKVLCKEEDTDNE